MVCRVFCAAAIFCLAASVCRAQDPTKVEPNHYRLQFENEHVQVVSVYYGAHEKSQMHDHPGGVVVVITGGHLRFTDEHGKVTEAYSKAGEARWFPPHKHKVENVGDEPYRAVYVGLKGRLNASDPNGGTAASEEIAAIMLEYATRESKQASASGDSH